MTKEQDQFQVWLMDMSDAIERFQQSLPSELQGRLDYSPESLEVVEGFALAKYSMVAEAKKQSEAFTVDGIARYVGQVFRKHLGGKWVIDFSDKKNAFYGLPQLSGMVGQKTQLCPLTLVTASLDRRTGKFIRTVFDNNVRNASQT
jgi:hypothetical protein